MTPAQEPKYGVTPQGQLINRQTLQIIPDDEPVFILRARDLKAAEALRYYFEICEDPHHKRAVATRIHDFETFAALSPERMKEPDTGTPPCLG